MTDEETVLAGRLMSVLTSPEAQRISFRLGTISVDGGGLYAVFSALSLGVISVTIADVPAGAAAQYSTSKNTFIFPRATYGTLPYDNVYMLHESVHAMQDIEFGMINPARGTFYTKESENEAAAYVAGCLFDLYGAAIGPDSSMIFQKAYEIANKIKGSKGALVADNDAQVLRAMITLHPVYIQDITYSSPTVSDGI